VSSGIVFFTRPWRHAFEGAIIATLFPLYSLLRFRGM